MPGPYIGRDLRVFVLIQAADGARCVEPDNANAARWGHGSKCTMRSFSDHSGIARNTVKKYLDTWDVMADRGYVPDRTELEPGEDIDVPVIYTTSSDRTSNITGIYK